MKRETIHRFEAEVFALRIMLLTDGLFLLFI